MVWTNAVIRRSLHRRVENACEFHQSGGMKRVRWVPLLLAVVLLAGCKKSGETVAAPPSLDDLLPKQAQPKLPTMKIYLGAETLDTELALTEREIFTGMMFRTNMAENQAMIFVLPYPQRASFWMKNCFIPLSVAYIDPDGVIQEIHDLQPQNTNPVLSAAGNVQFALETPQGWFARHNVGTGAVVRTEKGSLQETFFKKP